MQSHELLIGDVQNRLREIVTGASGGSYIVSAFINTSAASNAL